ncbi:AMP-binding protein [Nocardioides marmoriginsengisoli]|uniref:AMP-binding protein n=1 Tax=Nocardioides marmoriginsengisoli TaxID=661483 RepID=UPI0011CE078A|nr:AMP-binding protein [Nocardioides marmoriginsengisoli]
MYERSLPEVLLAHAEENPDRPFLEDVEGYSASYGQVLENSLRWADAWRRCEIGHGDRVAVFVPPSPQYIECWIGLTWLGAIEVGINPDYRGDMLASVLSDCGAKAVLVHVDYLDRLSEVLDRVPSLETIVVSGGPMSETVLPCEQISFDAFWDRAEVMSPPALPNPWDIATICYTSGTTGPSKGVRLPWGQVQHLASVNFEGLLTGEDAFYLPLPLFHIGGKVFPLLMAERGGRLVVRERFSATAFWSDIRKTRSTFTVLVGTMAGLLLKQPELPEDSDNPLWLLWAVPVPDRIEEFQKRFGIPRVMTSYTQTEMCAALRNQHVNESNRTSAGQIVPGVELAIVDEHDLPVPDGEIGQLLIRTREPWRLNAGYHGRPDATAEAWQNGWFHTGDAFRRDSDGWYYFIDRMKDCVRRGGENISSLEVERIVDQHPEVDTAACIGVKSDLGDEDVKICVQLTAGSTLSERELLEWLVAHMPRFMVPRYIEIVAEVPKTPNQRVQKAEFRKTPVNDRTWDRQAHDVDVPRH